MDVRHLDSDLQLLERDPKHGRGMNPAVVRGFRKVMNFIRSAKDERDIYAMNGMRFEKLQGDRKHERSLRINDQYRLIVEVEERPSGNCIVVKNIEDYH